MACLGPYSGGLFRGPAGGMYSGPYTGVCFVGYSGPTIELVLDSGPRVRESWRRDLRALGPLSNTKPIVLRGPFLGACFRGVSRGILQNT